MVSTNIWIAASDNELSTVQYLISEANISINAQDENGYTPLQAAVSYDHFELATFLLQNGADPNLADTDGETPLHHCESVRCAKLLMEFGADPNAKNDEDITPYANAFEEENQELSDFLRNYTNEVNVNQLSHSEASLAHVDYDGNPRYTEPSNEISLSQPFMNNFEAIVNDQTIQDEQERDQKLAALVLNLVQKDKVDDNSVME